MPSFFPPNLPNYNPTGADSGKIALGAALRELRRRGHVTQVELADRANTDDTYISHLEHGRIDIKWTTLERVLRALDATLDDLIAEIKKHPRR